jgi:hypothetical protein
MAVDFHIGRSGSVESAAFARELGQLVSEFLAIKAEVQMESVDVQGCVVGPVPERIEEERSILRVSIPRASAVRIIYLDMERRSGDRGIFLVSLDLERRPAHVVLAALCAEAICRLGGAYIDDEGYISRQPTPLNCGGLLERLRQTDRGRELLAEANRELAGLAT